MLVQIVLALAFIFFLWKALAKPSDYPPGPWGLPVIGYVSFGLSIPKRIEHEIKKHGNPPVISWRMGSQLSVFVLDYSLAKEAFSGRVCMGRPGMRILSFTGGPEIGLVMTNGYKWQSNRRFALHHLRDFGMGKSRLAKSITEEASLLVKTLVKNDEPLSSSFHLAVGNIIWQMVASKRFSSDDKERRRFDDLIWSSEEYWTRLTVLDFMPWLRAVIPQFIYRRVVDESMLINLIAKGESFLMKYVNDHIKELDPTNARDFIDAYLIQMKKEEADPLAKFSMKDLFGCIFDLYRAGTETVSNTLHWAVLYLAKYQKIQRKLQEEIDSVLPDKIPVTIEDKTRLLYTEAVIHEVHRSCCLLNLGVMHVATEEMKLGGYRIPKGSIVTSPTIVPHFDPRFWDSPKEFRPERFLDKEGKFSAPKEGFLPFGTGKRQCLGEALARMELFVFLTTLVQNLHFSEDPKHPIDLRPVHKQPFINNARDQTVLVTLR